MLPHDQTISSLHPVLPDQLGRCVCIENSALCSQEPPLRRRQSPRGSSVGRESRAVQQGFFHSSFPACAWQLWLVEIPPRSPLGDTLAASMCCEGRNRKQILPIITRPKMTGENESLCFHQSSEKLEMERLDSCPMKPKL